MLEPKIAELMQRILQDSKESVTAGKSARAIHSQYNLGSLRSNTLRLTARDRAEMATMLEANGFSLTPVAASGMSRSDKLGAGVPFEKTGGNAVKVGRVSLKALAGQGLQLNSKILELPDGGHLDVNWRTIAPVIGHDSILVVENYEVFDQIHRMSIDLPGDCASPLVIYRGDRLESRQDNVNAFLSALRIPVLACVDLDPQGLLIAYRLPRLCGVVAPSQAVLDALLSSPQTGRWDLYSAQLGSASAVLDAVPEDSAVRPLWEMLKKYRSAIVQERWISARERCHVWMPVNR